MPDTAPAPTADEQQAPPGPTLSQLRAAARERWGDYELDLEDGHPKAVLLNPLRLDSDVRKRMLTTGERVDAVQDDPPEVEKVRKKLHAAQNRLRPLLERRDDENAETPEQRVIEQHEARVAAEQERLEAAIKEHGKPEHQVFAEMIDIIREMVKECAASHDDAQRFDAALGGDITMWLTLLRQYMGRAQMGEAPPSPS